MSYIYMQKLANTPKIGTQKIIGVSETEITKVEARLNIRFPLSYKEFLRLAGDYAGNLIITEGAVSLDELSDKDYIDFMHKQLQKKGPHITRPFWVIGEKDGFDQFVFFYLDENTEDPNVYMVCQAVTDDGLNFIKPLNVKFSEFISGVIDRSILYSKRGY